MGCSVRAQVFFCVLSWSLEAREKGWRFGFVFSFTLRLLFMPSVSRMRGAVSGILRTFLAHFLCSVCSGDGLGIGAVSSWAFQNLSWPFLFKVYDIILCVYLFSCIVEASQFFFLFLNFLLILLRKSLWAWNIVQFFSQNSPLYVAWIVLLAYRLAFPI